MKILNWKTGEIIFEDNNVSSIKELVELAVRRNINLSYADLSVADLRNAYLGGVLLNDANLSGIKLNNAYLNGAYLVNTNLCGATLIDAKLNYADLRNANLTNANLTNANLNGVNLSNVKLNNMKIVSVDFQMGGDGRTALYLDGKKIKEGDAYHDKIEDFIKGFIFALDTMEVDYDFKSIEAVEENEIAWGIYENFDEIPNELQEFDKPSQKKL